VRVTKSRTLRSNLLAVGSCLAVYVVLSIVYHWATAPTIAGDSVIAAKATPHVAVSDQAGDRLTPSGLSEPAAAASESAASPRLASPSPSLTAPAIPQPSATFQAEPAIPTAATAPVAPAATLAPGSEPAAAPPAERTAKRVREVRKHHARATPRRERPVRQAWGRRNSWSFAWGSSYGNRPWF
jgi:hypothetical protein